MLGLKLPDMRAEMKRRKAQKLSLLETFIKEGELTTAQVVRIAGTGCSSRIKELRKEGHSIIASPDKGGSWRYTYMGQKDEE